MRKKILSTSLCFFWLHQNKTGTHRNLLAVYPTYTEAELRPHLDQGQGAAVRQRVVGALSVKPHITIHTGYDNVRRHNDGVS